jgi:zinc transport system permease protein
MTSLLEGVRALITQWAEAGWLPESLTYQFVINALLCGLLIGPLLGLVGPMVVIKRLAFFSQAVGNAALTGVSLGILLGEPYTSPLGALLGFTLLFGLLLNFLRHRTKMSSDTLIGVFLSASLGLGACLLLLVVSKINVHMLDSVLFGSILTVNDEDIGLLCVIAICSVLVLRETFNAMLLGSLNASLAQVQNVRVKLLEYVFIVMLTVITVGALKIIGAVLVEALLLIPAAAARNLSRSIPQFVGYSVLISTLSCVIGILVPVEFNIPVPSGGAIIVTATLFFAVTSVWRVARGA